jgi:hypothetical protein
MCNLWNRLGGGFSDLGVKRKFVVSFMVQTPWRRSHALNMTLGGSQSKSGCYREVKILLHLPTIKTQFPDFTDRSLTNLPTEPWLHR